MDDLVSIKNKIESLREKRTLIDMEIKALEDKLSKIPETNSDKQIINKSSSMPEKFKLFASLFAGRPDVHARRYQNAKKGTAGYTPVCLNEFNRYYCTKGNKNAKRIKCIHCKNQNFPKISLNEFIAHIGGKKPDCSDVMGSYPLDSDEMCTYIVADFDNKERIQTEDGVIQSNAKDDFEKMKKEAVAFYKTCEKFNTPACLEISRSGKGLHVWVFFSERVTAGKARRLYSGVLSAAMNMYADLSFSTYDRFIPSQDTLHNEGFGNLIALPLQGGAGRNRFSLFVDEELKPYPDQWVFLSNVKKLSPDELDKILINLSPYDELGELAPNNDGDDAGDEGAGDKSAIEINADGKKPWEKKKTEVRLTKDDFAGNIDIIYANMIYMEKCKLSVKAINKFKRLGAFKNPDFHKKQAMRLPTNNIPRIISTAEEDDEYIYIPRGALEKVLDILDAAGAEYHITERRTEGNPIDISFTGELREEQKPVADAMLKHDIGVLSATPAFGKTVIAAYMIANRAVNTLILVHLKELQKQWIEKMTAFLDIKTLPAAQYTPKGRKMNIGAIGEYGGAKKRLSGIVDIAMLPSLTKKGDADEFIKDYGLVIIDECHHIPAVSFEAVIKQVNAKYLYGLTATPSRDDGHHAILFLQCGPIRYKVDAIKQAEKRPFAHLIRPRFTQLPPTSVRDEKNYQQLLAEISIDENRNKLIANDIISAVKSGRNPIVLTERIEHLNKLTELLAGRCDNIIKLVGNRSAEEKNRSDSDLTGIKDGDEFVIVATGKYAGEGFDYPRLDTLFLTAPISWKGKVAQYTGRLHRNYEGKKDVIVYDYVDINIPLLERMYYKRIKGYKSVGYKTAAMDITAQDRTDTNVIFDVNEYWEIFKNDCIAAHKEIVISSPSLANKRITLLIDILSKKSIDRINITVITKPIAEYKENTRDAVKSARQRLTDAGIKIVERTALHQKAAVIDQRIVWYGSSNLLGYADNDENIMRLDGAEIALSLINNIMNE